MVEACPGSDPVLELMKASIPLRAKLMTLAALLAVVPAGFIGYRLVDVNTVTVKELSREVQLAVLDDVSRTINREFSDAQDGLLAVGRVLADEDLAAEVTIALALALVEANEALDHAVIYSAEGQLIDVIRQDNAPEIEPPELLPEVIRQHAAELNVATGEAEIRAGSARILMAVPLRVAGRITGYVTTWLALEVVQERIEHLARARFGGRNDSVFVVDRNLRLLARPDRERVARLASAAEEGILQTDPSELFRPDLVRSGEFQASDGTPMLGSSMVVPGRPWAVIAQIPQSEADASLRGMRLTVLVTSAAAAILALLLGFGRRAGSPPPWRA